MENVSNEMGTSQDTGKTIEYVKQDVPQMKGQIKIVDPEQKRVEREATAEGLGMQKKMSKEQKDELLAGVDEDQ
jgi:hypothetical protein